MNIYFEYDNKLINYINIGDSFIKKSINSNLSGLIDSIDNFDGSVFLLDESRFDYFGFDIYWDKLESISINDINQLLKEKYDYIQLNYGDLGEQLFYTFDNIYVNYEKQNYLISQKGKIFFRLNIYYLKRIDGYLFKKITGNKKFDNKLFKIFPKSFFLINHLMNCINCNDINILNISINSAKLIKINKGTYSLIEKIDIGVNKLKEVFEENDIIKLYYDSYKTKEMNQISLKLIKEAINYYSDILSHRTKDCLGNNSDIIVMGDVLSNKFFIDGFGDYYTKFAKGFVLPFHCSSGFNNFKRKWHHSDLEFLAYLNSNYSFK